MGQTLSSVPQRVERVRAKIHEHHQNRQKRGPRMKRTEKTTVCVDADFQLRQQCVWKGKPEIKSFHKPTLVHAAHLDGDDISFAYVPEMRMDTQPHRVLKIPRSIVDADSICKLYHEMCRRIYAYDQANELARPDAHEDDICLWIKPYAEIRVERNMNGVEERKCIKATTGTTRLKNRMLFVKWMLENSDWQEQLMRNFWNLPKYGVGRDVTLPWFSLEVEYKPNGRKKLFEAHKHEFEAREITLEMFHPKTLIETDGIIIENREIMVEAGRIVIENRELVVEAGELVVTNEETVVEYGELVIEEGKRY